jgi:hypothetical protein
MVYVNFLEVVEALHEMMHTIKQRSQKQQAVAVVQGKVHA